MHSHDDLLVALVGQPNSGKSTVFNYLTGLHQTVANYPGVTVAKKSGHYHEGKRRIEVVDLPGTYSLTSYSQEERVTRDFLLLERPEVVVLVMDAANLRRHLYLAFQLRELQVPLVVCLNMMDIAQRRGFQIDVLKLEKILGVPVVPTVARCRQKHSTCKCAHCPSDTVETGLESLRHQINIVAQQHAHETPSDWQIDYGELEPLLAEIDVCLAEKPALAQDFPTRWLAIKLLENDREARRIIQHHLHEPGWEGLLHVCVQKIERYCNIPNGGEEAISRPSVLLDDSPKKIIAARRNDYAEQIEKEVAPRFSRPRRRSDRVDKILCHPIVGLFCVAAVLFLTFSLAFNIAGEWAWIPWKGEETAIGWQTPMGAIETIFDEGIPHYLDEWFPLPDEPKQWQEDLHSLIHDGIIAGVGAVIVFVPLLFFVFLLVAALEQSGYMARVAVVLDRLMRLFGLHGQSVMPMVLAGGIVGGCAVPAVMATRTMREQRERLLTILILPLMNCGAKVPVFALLIAAFFSAYQGLMMAATIFISWTCALLAALLLGKCFVKGKSSPLLIELPTYQVPMVRDVLFTACLQSCWFLKRAGTIIFVAVIILWALMYYPTRSVETSYAAQIGRLFEPVSQYAGFDWKDNVALIGGMAAKETIVSTMSTMYILDEEEKGKEERNGGGAENEAAGVEGVNNEDAKSEEMFEVAEMDEDEMIEEWGRRLATKPGWSPLKAFVLLLFVMLYCPCLATCIVIWRETGYIKYMLIAILYTNVLAFCLAVAVYQMGNLVT